MPSNVLRSLLCLVLSAFSIARAAEPASRPLAPEAALRGVTSPEGFRVTMFAAEPDVVQPIAMATDDRGRLWVVECLSYPDWSGKNGNHDRVIILEDRDQDGKFDTKKTFLSNGRNLSGIALGFGGVWLLSAPEMIFIPDRDRDDVPDGPAEVALTGWSLHLQHNMVNGLTWGPDGWLYGCHGIIADSRVGPPGAPEAEKIQMNCGVWRYHPVKKKIEVVANGTTNPWGIGFDDYGQMFIANCVIKHLFHVIPGARYERMYGQDSNPYAFKLIPSCADHIHWAGGYWNTEGAEHPQNDAFGGGHAHSGTMIYLGDTWPERYRNTFFSLNVHGRRANNDRLERQGSGYVAKHEKDTLIFSDPWFRGVSLIYGPDGGVFIADWSDTDECHDLEDIHRDNGRIYKAAYGNSAAAPVNIASLTDSELVRLQLHKNDWWVTQARLALQQRAAEGKLSASARAELLALLRGQSDATRQLRALWALHVTGGVDEALVQELLGSRQENVRAWTIQLALEDRQPSASLLPKLERLARKDESPVVRLYLAAALQRLGPAERLGLASQLVARAEDNGDPNIPILLWHGIEPLVSADDAHAQRLLDQARLSLVRQFIARRLGLRLSLNPLARALATADDATQRDVVEGMFDALNGRRALAAPENWQAASARLARHSDASVREKALLLSLVFGEKEAEAQIQRTVTDTALPQEKRRRALDALVQARTDGLPVFLQSLLRDAALRGSALRGLAAFDHPETASEILKSYAAFSPEERADAINTLASRASGAVALLQAVKAGSVPRRDVTPFSARQIAALKDARIAPLLGEVLGEVRSVSKDKAAEIARYTRLLNPAAVKAANPSNGRALYARTCAPCHTLFGEGGDLAPELTGSGRSDLSYILENVVDPNAVVWSQYRATYFETADDRLISGVVRQENESAVTIQTQTGTVTLPRNEITSRRESGLSMMPEGLFETLAEQEVLDLVAYLQSPAQVPLPKQP